MNPKIYAVTEDNQLLELPIAVFADLHLYLVIEVDYTFEHLPEDRYFNIVSILIVVFGFSPLEVFLKTPKVIQNKDTLKLDMRFNKEHDKLKTN